MFILLIYNLLHFSQASINSSVLPCEVSSNITNCVVGFVKNIQGTTQICYYQNGGSIDYNNRRCSPANLNDLTSLRTILEDHAQYTIFLSLNDEAKENMIKLMLKETHMERGSPAQVNNSNTAIVCNDTEIMLIIQSLHKLNDRFATDCKLMIAENNTLGECLARGLAKSILLDKPFQCLEVLVFNISEQYFHAIEFRLKSFGNMRKAFYLFIGKHITSSLLSQIDIMENDSIWITETGNYEQHLSHLQLLGYKRLHTSTLYPVTIAMDQLQVTDKKLDKIKEEYNSNNFFEISTLSHRRFTRLFNVEKIGDNDVELRRFPDSPDVDSVDSIATRGNYKIVSILDEPMLMEHSAKYRKETNTCKRDHVLCSVPVKNKDGAITMKKSCCYGYIADLLMHYTKTLNFKFTLSIVKDGVYGGFIPERQTYNGLIGDVLNNKADMAFAAIAITYQRSNYVDFTAPFMRSDIDFILPPELPDTHYLTFKFIAHISPEAIYVSLVVYLVVTILLYICDNALSYFHTLSAEKISLRRIFSFYIFNDCFLYTGALIFQRDIGGKAPKTVSGKILAQIFAFGMVIAVTVYTATLTAHNVSNKQRDDFLGLKDPRMLNPTNQFKFATQSNSGVEEFFKGSKNEDLLNMYRFMEKFNVKSISEGVKRVQEGRLHAFIAEPKFLNHEKSKKNGCHLKTKNLASERLGFGIAVRKGSSIQETFSEVILNLEERGELSKLEHKWFEDCSAEDQASVLSRFSLFLFATPFLMLGGFIILSTLLVICEMLWAKYQQNGKSKKRQRLQELGAIEEMTNLCRKKSGLSQLKTL